ncbi:uncharacterized protein LOC127262908 [Andrographis paniculata]|uniref:uncharacterized protein LOC127262908 n=1 Tax=Andrographis paniculata TaxID=175694 RepID=UPI0021E8884B|nr:uncharacterized protein LOC127262908 [Andrographis paniculata]
MQKTAKTMADVVSFDQHSCGMFPRIISPYDDGKLSSFYVTEGLDSIWQHTIFDEGYKFDPQPKENPSKTKYLLALAVGIKQKVIVNKIVSKFSENFTIVLFHYDGRASEWDNEWSQRAIHISAKRQTKWWYVKRFLHPNIVAEYEYIFIWDEDFGVENFSAEEYIKVVKKYGLEISQPAVTSTKGLTYKMTLKRDGVEVHWQAVEDNCQSLFLPPCAGFVEIMAPVFSSNIWSCVWNMIQNDLVHGWGIDFEFYRCVEKPHIRIGVVDSQWINHLVLPTLSNEVLLVAYKDKHIYTVW